MAFEIDTLCFYDTETKSRAAAPFDDVTVVGGPAYFQRGGAKVILLPYAIGDGPVQLVENWGGIRYRDLPDELRTHYERGLYVAFNAAFDRDAWTYGIEGARPMAVREIIDAMAQVVASNMPPSLEGASQALQRGGKHPEGKRLIKLFCGADAKGNPQTHPDEWQLFKQYAIEDVEELRGVFKATRQLPLTEWEEYWACEAINERGMPIDVAFAERAAAVAALNTQRSNRLLSEMTGGKITAVTQRERIANWVWDRLVGHAEARSIMTKQVREDPDSEDGDLVVTKIGIDRHRIEALLAYFDAINEREGLTDEEATICDMLEIRQWDGSATPAKYEKMLLQHVDGKLQNSYAFNGAAQTGRFSSRGVQVHNLVRSYVGAEEKDAGLEAAAIEEVNDAAAPDSAFLDSLAERYGPVARTLGRLIRPTIIADPGRTLVWGDWSAIEARMLPWLAGSRGADKVLDIFRSNDADPSAPDIYMIQAGMILEKDPADVTKDERQAFGKVPVLSLGFGGGEGALLAMAANYGVHIGENMRARIVESWRSGNAWARHFWGRHTRDESYGLWGAFNSALENPGMIYEAGRVAYVCDRDYLGGTVFCALPSGRLLTYPSVKVRELKFKNKMTGEDETKVNLSYRRGYGYSGLWYGKLAENVTQAEASTLLRRLLVKLEQPGIVERMPAIGHTHDEGVTMPLERDTEWAKVKLLELMETNDDWNEGLPLKAEISSNWYYSKAVG